METPSFRPFKLRIVSPLFDSKLTDSIIELEKLRPGRQLKSTVHPVIFFQLKSVFHFLESLGSVRIEGNNTTLSELIEKTIDGSINTSTEERTKEYLNGLSALEFVEKTVTKGMQINRLFISELHKQVVDGLSKEGDRTPGSYRTWPVQISNADHLPPPPHQVNDYMDELLTFTNQYSSQSKYNLLAIALAHHRFSWVHPFGNGNGRVVRLFTYALLLSTGFSVDGILNPTAIFCIDRKKYYSKLERADAGTDAGLLEWCEYVLENLSKEIAKIENLLSLDYLLEKIITPALDESLEKKIITQSEYKVLYFGCKNGEFKAADVNTFLEKKYPYEVSRVINKLKAEKMIAPTPGSQRKYYVSFLNNLLLRGFIEALRKAGFVPFND